MAGRQASFTSELGGGSRQAAPNGAAKDVDRGSAPPGIVIWDLENCAIPARLNEQLPTLVKALRSSFRASRVVTAAEIPATGTAKTDQLRALSYSDVEVLTFLRPDSINTSAKKHSSADYMLKRVRCSRKAPCRYWPKPRN